MLADGALDVDKEPLRPAGWKLQSPTKLARREFHRRGRAADSRAPDDVVEALVSENQPIVQILVGYKPPPPRARLSADLENIGEVGGEFDDQRELDLVLGKIAYREALVTRADTQHLAAQQVHVFAGEHELPLGEDIGVGQIDGKHDIVL